MSSLGHKGEIMSIFDGYVCSLMSSRHYPVFLDILIECGKLPDEEEIAAHYLTERYNVEPTYFCYWGVVSNTLDFHRPTLELANLLILEKSMQGYEGFYAIHKWLTCLQEMESKVTPEQVKNVVKKYVIPFATPLFINQSQNHLYLQSHWPQVQAYLETQIDQLECQRKPPLPKEVVNLKIELD